MIDENAIAQEPIGASASGPTTPDDAIFFDINSTVLSQYANSPVMMRLIATFSEWLDPSSRFSQFYYDIWNIDRAKGFGLDIWGRILGVGRILQVPTGVYLGFASDVDAKPFGYGIFYGGGRSTNNASLTDDAYRTLLLAKAALNITDSSAPAINQILLALFGQGYVRDNRDMSITYVFTEALDPLETAIVYQSGVLPKPCGVSFTVEAP